MERRNLLTGARERSCFTWNEAGADLLERCFLYPVERNKAELVVRSTGQGGKICKECSPYSYQSFSVAGNHMV